MLDVRKLPYTDLGQSEFVNFFYDNFNFDGLQFANVEPLRYTGLIAGSEFLLFVATKLYLCLDFDCSCIAPSIVAHGVVEFFDEANAPFFSGQNNDAFTTPGNVINYIRNNVYLKNFYFSRLTSQGYPYMKFIGYRITLAP